MKKKPTAQPSITENNIDGFSVESVSGDTATPSPTPPAIASPVEVDPRVDPPATTTVIPDPIGNPSPTPTPSPSPIPTIDKNAELKIETVEVPVVDELPPEEKNGKLIFILGTVVGLLIVAGVISFTLIYYTTPPTQKPITITETAPTPTPQTQITEAPKQVLKKEEIPFEVLNSTKTSGLAAKYSKTIEGLGFKVCTTGNSEEKVTGLKFYFSSSLSSQKEQLVSDLKKESPNAEYTGTLPESANKIRLIIGN